jgi:probable HAF family extracellular repeat protein
MKRILTGIVAATLATVVDAQSSRYFLQDLGTLPGATFSQGSDMNDWGVVAGISATPEGTQHAVLWVAGRPVDIAGRTRGGLNTGAFGINEWGQVSMQVETATPDPNGEDFCGYGTHLTCRAARWHLGVLTRLRTLEGTNATAGNINNLGQIPGTAETNIVDASCSASQSSQVLQYRPVIWEPNPETIRQLPLLSGDTVGVAARINDKGQAVGFSGSCGDSALLPLPFGPHAVLWDKDAAVHDLGNLGAATVNIALAINNRGEVVGASSLAADSTPFYRTDAFLWTRRQGMQDLGTLPGDVHSGATGINDRGEVVGLSGDGAGNIRAFHWQEGAMRDLNTLVPADAPVYLLFATAINADGAIAGWGVHKETGEVHAFKLIPVKER